MKNITSFTYQVIQEDDHITKEIEYKDYSKNANNEENILLYKNVLKDNDIFESFNKMQKSKKEIKEIVGSSMNKNYWDIQEYENSTMKKEYKKDYDNLKLNIDYNLIDKIHNQDKKYIKDKSE